MSENPYAPPQADSQVPVTGVLSGQLEDLIRVAKYQKGLLVCILIQIILYVGVVVGQANASLAVQGMAGLGLLLAGIMALCFVIFLAMRVFHPAVGILLGILTLVPCLGLVVLVAVNGRATNILTQNGYRVGLMGAKMSQFPRR